MRNWAPGVVPLFIVFDRNAVSHSMKEKDCWYGIHSTRAEAQAEIDAGNEDFLEIAETYASPSLASWLKGEMV